MSDYAGVTPIPDYLNISNWYELVDGDTIPNGWSAIVLYPNGNVDIIGEAYGYQTRSVGSALRYRHRLFTRTPPPSAIKRIRAAETKQDELPAEPEHLDLQAIQQELDAVEKRRARDWEDNLNARQLHNKWIFEIRDDTERVRKLLDHLATKVDALIDGL